MNQGQAPMTTATEPGRRPLEVYGWVLMTSIWLVFLAFPAIAVWTEVPSVALRVVGIGVIAAFAATYVRAFLLLFALPDDAPTTRIGWTHLAGLLACTLVLAWLIGGECFGTLPYLVALSVFTLPFRWVVLVTTACLLIPLALPALGLTEPGSEFLTLVVALVAVSTGLVQYMEQREREHELAARTLHITAERDRVARDVHDVLAHTLTVVATKSDLAARLIDTEPARARSEVGQIRPEWNRRGPPVDR